MAKIDITYRPVAALRDNPRNARTHSPKQVAQIAASISEFGFITPILVDKTGEIIAGHGRVAAAKSLGLKTVPCVRIEHLTKAQKRAFILADNRIAENAGWDNELLALELQDLSAPELDFDVTLTGFEMAEIDVLLRSDLDEETTSCPADELIEPPGGPSVTQLGDIWQIGRHRLICGDALDPTTYDRLLDGDLAQMVFTDPPYNVRIDGHVSGLGGTKHREFAMASGEMSPDEFEHFLTSTFTNLAQHSADGAICFVCMDWRHLREVVSAADGIFSEVKNLCVWAKTNGGMGTLYRSQHELVFVFKSGRGPHINNVQLGKHGRYRTNVWTYAGANAFGASRDDDLAMHPTVKPVGLVADAILDCSNRNGIVLDAFGGSGTTLVAAERTGRCGHAIELDPQYCDVIVRRLEKIAGIQARLAGTDASFDDVTVERTGEVPTEEGN